MVEQVVQCADRTQVLAAVEVEECLKAAATIGQEADPCRTLLVEGVIGLTIKLVAEEVGAVETNGIEVRFF
jgi:hypothetical protein